jgi:hypothetical protein
MKSNNNENITEVKEKEDVKNELSKRVFYIQQSKKTTSSCSRGVFIVVNKNITQNDLYNVDVENFLDDYFPDEGDIWFKVDEHEEMMKRVTKDLNELERKRVLSHPFGGHFVIVDKTEHFKEHFFEGGLINTKYLPEDTLDYYNHIFIVNVSVEEDGTIVMMGR